MRNFFISYNQADRRWAEWVGWQLEEQGYTVFLQDWDFRPGGNFVLEMQRAAQEAERTIAVLSPGYLSALYTQSEWAAAFVNDPIGAQNKLLPVRVQECRPEGLLKSIVYIDLVGLPEHDAQKALMAGIKTGRAEAAIKIAQRNGWLLHIALDQLSLGRAWLMRTLAEKTGDFTKAMDYLHQAVAGLRKSGAQHHLPRGLFARAEGYRWQREFNAAWADLQEALEIARAGGMKLFLADYHLEAGKLRAAQGKQPDAGVHFATAKKMMEEMGYKKKLPEVTGLLEF